jgi:trehalose 6-phosphate synthase/phosphatase
MAEQNQQSLKGGSHLSTVQETSNLSHSSSGSLSRNQFGEDSENSSPELAHERISNITIPVTPDIHPATYKTPALQRSNDAESLGYFTQDPNKHSRPSKPSSRPQAFDEARRSSLNDLLKGAMSSEEILRRMSQAVGGRSESISDIKSAAPDLALTGNIISVTFTLPHTFIYHKNGEWVCSTILLSFVWQN